MNKNIVLLYREILKNEKDSTPSSAAIQVNIIILIEFK